MRVALKITSDGTIPTGKEAVTVRAFRSTRASMPGDWPKLGWVMYANPSGATAMPNGPPGSAIRATVPSPPGTGRVVTSPFVFSSVGVEQPTASVAPIAAAIRIVGSRLMRPSHEMG